MGNSIFPSEKTELILELIANGNSYEQILTAYPQLTYLDIFFAARQALEALDTLKKINRAKANIQDLTPHEEVVFKALREWRYQRSQELDFAPFMIAHDKWLKEIARMHSEFGIKFTKEHLMLVSGFGKRRTERYGDEIIRVLNSIPL